MKLLLLGLLGVFIALVIEWAIVCGVVYILSLCFHFAFDLLLATGIWLLYEIAHSFFKSIFKKK